MAYALQSLNVITPSELCCQQNLGSKGELARVFRCSSNNRKAITARFSYDRKFQRQRSLKIYASATDSRGLPMPENLKVIGMGGVCIDYLAVVGHFPEPDEKMRSETLEVQGGGNCGNALTAAARLGLEPQIITKVGLDGTGEEIIQGLEQEGVGCSTLVRGEGSSPMTYIIVDQQGETRTCIHTPGPAMEASELPSPSEVLAGAALVYFDGRLTEAAITLAQAAREAGVTVLVEAERVRPHLDELIPLADYIVTSKHFPQDFTGEPDVADACLAMIAALPNLKYMITTLGSKGSIMLEQAAEGEEANDSKQMKEIIDTFMANSTGFEVQESGLVTLGLSPSAVTGTPAGKDAQIQAAVKEATRNADSDNAAKYSTAVMTAEKVNVTARVAFSPAWPLEADQVVDTTGAGDSFIGSVCYAICAGFSSAKTLQLASYVAATNCRSLGPRPGLPTREEVPEWLLK